MTVALVILAVVAVPALLALGVTVSYNRFVRQRGLVRESWRQIDIELHRRYDLVPALVEAAQECAADEGAVVAEVRRRRALAAAGGSGDLALRASREAAFSAALRELFATAERYPRLRLNHDFLALQRRLSEVEDRIAAGRRFYNANVRTYNSRVTAFPSRLVAAQFGFVTAGRFDVEEYEVRAAPLAGPGGSAPQVGKPLPVTPRRPVAPPADPSPQLGS